MADTKTPGVDTPNISNINPLICDSEWNADTAHNIRCALEFLADSIPYVSDCGFDKDTAHGANLLIRTCVKALEVYRG